MGILVSDERNAREILRDLRRPLLVIGAAFLALLGLQAWTSYYPRSELFALAGLPGERANDGRHCSRMTSFGGRVRRSPIPEITCYASPSRHASVRVPSESTFSRLHGETQRVAMSFWSRKPAAAQRNLWFADSVSWSNALDSLVRAVEGRGAIKRECSRAYHARIRGLRMLETWTLGAFDVSVQAMHNPRNEDREWNLYISARPSPVSC